MVTVVMTAMVLLVVVQVRRRRDGLGQLGIHLHGVRHEVSLVAVVRRRRVLLVDDDVDAAARLPCTLR